MAPRFTIKAGDTRPSIPSTLVYADGSVADLTDAAVRFRMRPEGQPDATLTVDAEADRLEPLTAGRVAYHWEPTDTVPGAYTADWLYTKGEEVATFPNDGPIYVHVRPGASG